MLTGRLARILGSVALVTGIATGGSAVVMTGAGAVGASTGSGGGDKAAYNCTGGQHPPGTYESMTISGVCLTPFGNVKVAKNLTVEPGALLDNGAPGDPTSAPVVAANLYVGGNVNVAKGAVINRLSSPGADCSTGLTAIGIQVAG